MTISLVLFDLGDVVCSFRLERRMIAYRELCGLSEAEIRTRLVDSGYSLACDQGRFDSDEMCAELSRRLEVEISRERASELQLLAFDLRPEVLALAQRVARDVATGLLTNNAPLLRDVLPTEIMESFDPILFSYEFGSTKPSRALFDAVVSRTGVAPESIVLIDDSESNVIGARAAGWRAVHFDSVEDTVTQLDALGVFDQRG